MNKTSIIIPVYNNFAFTKACINDLMKLKSNVEIIIVDNNSSDETQNLDKHFKDIKIIKKLNGYNFIFRFIISY